MACGMTITPSLALIPLTLLAVFSHTGLAQMIPKPDVSRENAANPVVEGGSSAGSQFGCIVITRLSDALQVELRWLLNGTALPITLQVDASVPVAATNQRIHTNVLNLTRRGVFLEADAGLYTCRAVNINDTLQVTSRYLALVVDVPAQILALESREAVVQEDVTLTCLTRGTPPINYTWSMGDTIVQQNSSNSNRNDLVLSGVDRNDTGNYSCTASNIYATAVNIAILDVIELPNLGDTFAPDAQPDQLRRIRLVWTAEFFDGNTPITEYLARCEAAGITASSGSLAPSSRTFTFDGLHPGRQYTCVLTVSNKVGSSDSLPAMATVLEEAPNAAPTMTSANALSPTSIEVTWQGIADAALFGVLRGYRIFYTATECGSCLCSYECSTDDSVVVTAGQPLSRTIEGLRRFTTYDVTVLVFNDAGAGPRGTTSSVRTSEELPSAPVSFVAEPEEGTGAMALRFSAPLEPNGVITHYELTYDSLDPAFPIQPESLTVTEGLNQVVILVSLSNLRRLTSYTFSVRAVNGAGVGAAATANGTVAAFPIIIEAAGLVAFSESTSEVMLRCPFAGVPAPVITWRRLGNATTVLGNADGGLTLRDVQASDAGVYTCIATNVWGVAQNNVTVTVVPSTSYIISGFKDTYFYLCIGAAVLLLFCLVTICILRCRRRKGRSSKSSNFYHDQYNNPGVGLNNPGFVDPAGDQASPSLTNRYHNGGGGGGGAAAGQQTPQAAKRTPGVGVAHPPQTYAQPSDSLDGHLNQSAGTFQQQQQQQGDYSQYRKTVTPLTTLNNQPHHQQEASMLSTVSSQYPGGGGSFDSPAKYATTSTNNLHPDSVTGGGPNNAQSFQMNQVGGASAAATEQLPTYTARHGDHILTAM